MARDPNTGRFVRADAQPVLHRVQPEPVDLTPRAQLAIVFGVIVVCAAGLALVARWLGAW